ncbi:MAG: site-specific integrase [Muribaculaceae bacterium]|nr:site-specific integrase [Muribaculaceae bacterium]
MSYLTKRNTASELLGFTYPKLHTGKTWYVDFYANDPSTGEMRRKKYKLDGLKKISEKKRRAAEIIEAVTRELRGGWNPWVNAQESRGFTLIQDCLDRYLEYIEKKGDRYKTRMRYKSSVNILREFFESLVVPPKFVYQFDQALIIDFLDWILLDRDASARTRNNYRAWVFGLCEFLKSRKYITVNPVENIEILRETAKKRKDLSKEQLAKMRKYLTEKDPHFLLACEMEYYTFIRPNELSHLRVRDVSLENQTIFVSGTFSKNHKDGYVGINKRICKLMIELKVLEQPGEYYLFGKGFFPRTERYNADQYNRRWKKMREELGWSEEYQFYSLKDSGIRDLANDAGIVVARDQARHSDVATTNRYIQVHPNDVHEATKTFEGEL